MLVLAMVYIEFFPASIETVQSLMIAGIDLGILQLQQV